EAVDSLIFYTGAFYGVVPNEALLESIRLQWLLKTGYEVLMTPVTYPLVAWLKRYEGYDWFDSGQDYNPFKVERRGRWRRRRRPRRRWSADRFSSAGSR